MHLCFALKFSLIVTFLLSLFPLFPWPMFPRRPLSTWQIQPALSRRVLAGIFAPGGTVCGAKATVIAAEVSVAAVAVEDHTAPGNQFSGHGNSSLSTSAIAWNTG